MRIAHRLGEDVVKMSHVEGFKANVTTAFLVGLAATGPFVLASAFSYGDVVGQARASSTGRSVSPPLREKGPQPDRNASTPGWSLNRAGGRLSR